VWFETDRAIFALDRIAAEVLSYDGFAFESSRRSTGCADWLPALRPAPQADAALFLRIQFAADFPGRSN